MSLIKLFLDYRENKKKKNLGLAAHLGVSIPLQDYTEKMIATSNELMLINKYILIIEEYFKNEKEKLNVYFDVANNLIVANPNKKKPLAKLYSHFNFHVQVLFQNSKESEPHYLLDHWNSGEVPFFDKNKSPKECFRKFFRTLECKDITFDNRKELYEKWIGDYFSKFKKHSWPSKSAIHHFCQNIDNPVYKNNLNTIIDGYEYVLLSKDIFEKVENNHDNFVVEETRAMSILLNEVIDYIFKEVHTKHNNFCIVRPYVINHDNLMKYSLEKENKGAIFELSVDNNLDKNKKFHGQFFCFADSLKNYTSKADIADDVLTINPDNFDFMLRCVFARLFEGSNDDKEMFFETLNLKKYVQCKAEYEKEKLNLVLDKFSDEKLIKKRRL